MPFPAVKPETAEGGILPPETVPLRAALRRTSPATTGEESLFNTIISIAVRSRRHQGCVRFKPFFSRAETPIRQNGAMASGEKFGQKWGKLAGAKKIRSLPNEVKNRALSKITK